MNQLITNIQWKKVGIGAFWAVTILGYFSLVAVVMVYFSPILDEQLTNPVTGEACRGDATVVNIPISGSLYTYHFEEGDTASLDITQLIRRANDSPNISAIVLEIDSPGGDPTAGEEIAAAVAASEKPVYALARGYATSAAYWAGLTSKAFYAHSTSLVGSIGITASYVDAAEKNKRDGLTYNQLSTGKFKDLFDPNKPLTKDERTHIETELNKFKELFVDQVATLRKLPREEVVALADGSALLGGDAKTKKLIDEVGTMTDVKKRIEADTGTPALLCW